MEKKNQVKLNQANIEKTKLQIEKWLGNSTEIIGAGNTGNEKREYLNNLYRGINIASENVPAWRSKLFLGLTFGQVQSKLATVLPILSNAGDFYIIKPFRKTIEINGKKIDAELSAKIMQLIMKTQEPEMKLYQNLFIMTLSTLIFSRCWSKLTWEKKTKYKKYFDYDKGEIEEIEQPEKINRPKLETIPDWDMIIPADIYSIDIDDMEFLGNWFWIDPRDLVNNNYYNNQEEVSKFLETLGEKDNWPPKVRLAEIWTNTNVYVYGNGCILKSHYTPYKHNKKPYAYMIENPNGFGIEGISSVEMYADIQEWINSLVNGNIDEMRINLHKIFLLKSSSDLSTSQIKTRPGLVIRVRDLNEFKELPTNPPSGAVYQQIAQMDAFTNQILGNTDQIDQKANQTATEARLSFSRASGRIKLFIDYNKANYIKRILYLWLELNQQFMDKDKISEFVPDIQLEKIGFEKNNVDLKSKFIYIVSGDKGLDDKNIMMDKINTLMDGMNKINTLPDFINKINVAKMLIKTVDYDPDSFFNEEDMGNNQKNTNQSVEEIRTEIETTAKAQGITSEQLLQGLSEKLQIPIETLIDKITEAGSLNKFLTEINNSPKQA